MPIHVEGTCTLQESLYDYIPHTLQNGRDKYVEIIVTSLLSPSLVCVISFIGNIVKISLFLFTEYKNILLANIYRKCYTKY